MPWGRLEDDLPDNERVLSLTDREFRAWVYSIARCNAKRTKKPATYDRMTPAEAEAICRLVKSGPKLAGGLVEKGSWEAVASGYIVHDLRDFAPKRDDTNAVRQARFKQKGRVTSGGVTAESNGGNAVSPHAHARSPVPVPVPVPNPVPCLSTSEHQPEETDSQEETHLVARARVFAVPKPGEKLGSPHAALSRALADAIGHEEPQGDRRWKEAIGVLVKCGVTADEAAGLVSTYLEHYTTPISARAIAENLTALRHPRVGRGKGKPESVRDTNAMAAVEAFSAPRAALR